MELLVPLHLGKVHTDGNYAYYERVDAEMLVVSKKNTQKIERKHRRYERGVADWSEREYVFQKQYKCTKSSSDWASIIGSSAIAG